MNKLLGILIVIGLLLGIFSSAYACHFRKVKAKKIEVKTITPEVAVDVTESKGVKEIELLPTMNSESKSPNRIWVGTFQIVWNEMVDNIIKHPVEFVGGTTQAAKDLNAREFKKTDIGKESYYTTYGIVAPELKTKIEKAIKEKFNETSDILDLFDFTYDPSKILIYAMLKKDFQFLEAFDKLGENSFGQNPNKIEYFGINENSSHKLYQNVSVLFYNSPSDYAVKLYTKTNDEVILYRTNEDKKFNEFYADVQQKAKKFNGNKYFGEDDRLKVPNINLYQMTNFPDVEGRPIVNSNFHIDQTIETVEFKMNNEGVYLKSEAAIMMKYTSVGRPPQIRRFYFDDAFVLFLIEKNKTVPYFALFANDVETLNKTGKKK